jgi:hypothetical protein
LIRDIVMSLKANRSLISGFLYFFVILNLMLLFSSFPGFSQEAQAPDFQATDLDGKSQSLGDYRGEAVLLHITNIENPLCRECELRQVSWRS